MYLCKGFAFTPPMLAGVWGACVPVRVLPLPSQSWLGLLCVILQACFAFSPPILASGWGVCGWVRVLPCPHQSWLGFVVQVFGYGLCLHPSNPGWWLVLCVWLRAWPSPRQSSLGCCVCVCLCGGATCTPPIRAGVCGVCVWVWVLHLLRPSWMGFVVFVFGCQFCLHPARHGWGEGCLCLGVHFLLSPPILSQVCGVVVWARVLPSSRQSWLGFVVCVFRCLCGLQPANHGWGVGCVCLCVRITPVPRQFLLV